MKIFHEEGYFLAGIHIFPEEMAIDEDDLKEEIVYLPKLFFEDIESEVIKRINGAEAQINIVMYRFTNPKIYKVLMKKKEEGVHIEIILDDNENNKKEAKNWPELNIHYYKPGENNIMHNKFCIIDMNMVIRGSYNWTNAANYNNEEISVDMTSSTVKAYAAVFDKLRIDAT